MGVAFDQPVTGRDDVEAVAVEVQLIQGQAGDMTAGADVGLAKRHLAVAEFGTMHFERRQAARIEIGELAGAGALERATQMQVLEIEP